MKFKFLIVSIIVELLTVNIIAQVGIGTTSPNSSAILELQSTEKGLLPPRMTTSQREEIISPAEGLLIFNITTGCLNYFYSNSWYEWCGSLSPFICGTSKVRFSYNGSEVAYGTVVSVNNKCWLDRNLGATRVATSSTDENAYGDLFQWGRLDDGHQVRTSPTTTTLSNSDVPGHGNFICFIFQYPEDWRSPQNDDLWQGETGTNNPCPEGFRLPTEEELINETFSWPTYNAEGAFNSPLKLPMAGDRDPFSGLVDHQGFDGNYWTSTVNGIYSWALHFQSDTYGEVPERRSGGFSVRCIKD